MTLVAVLAFLGATALAGGVALSLGDGGQRPPEEWLADIPLVDSWTVPGLVLGLVFGIGSLVVAGGVLRRPHWRWLARLERRIGHHWSWLAAQLLGAGMVTWIVLELFYLPELSFLQAVYGAVGGGLVALPLTPTARRHLGRERC